MKRRPTIFRNLFLCMILCASACTCQNSEAAPFEQTLDKRITQSDTFSLLIPKNQWQEAGHVPSDFTQQLRGCQTGISNTLGGYNAWRANNLAACGHYDEAIGELNQAIGCYDENGSAERSGRSLDAQWLINRARLYEKVGRSSDSLADIERSLTMKQLSDQSLCEDAMLLAEFGKYSRAESVVPNAESGTAIFRPYFSYLRAVLQEKQGKSEMAKENFKVAATLFAAGGSTAPAQACLDAIAALEPSKFSESRKLQISDLKPPNSNHEKITRLMKALASNPDIFDFEVLKPLIGATKIQEFGNGYIIVPYLGFYKELSLVSIDKLNSGGKRLNIHLQPELCTIDKSVLNGMLGKPVKSQNHWRHDVAVTEAYKVPSGTLVLNTRKGGFNPIWIAQLYSNDALFPEPVQEPNQVDTTQRTLLRQTSIIRFLENDGNANIEKAQEDVAELLRSDPENPRIHMEQAEVFFRQGKLEDAVRSIDTAIKYGDRDKLLDSKYTGNVLLIRKGAYQLEQGKFEQAFANFEIAFPPKPSADLLTLRARAEVGLKKYSIAEKDLKEALNKYYDEARIVKRDETQRLLDSVRKH